MVLFGIFVLLGYFTCDALLICGLTVVFGLCFLITYGFSLMVLVIWACVNCGCEFCLLVLMLLYA